MTSSALPGSRVAMRPLGPVGPDGANGTTTTTGTDGTLAEVLAATSAASASRMTSENFPVALRFVPAAPRAELVAAYHFARFVDDLGDGDRGAPADPERRLAALDAVDAQVAALPDTPASLDAVRGLAPLVARRPEAGAAMRALVEANRVDQQVDSYETFADLVGYCRLSADPVGRLVLAVAGVDDPALLAASDDVCTALQVLEHCQDVGEDARRAPRGRVYLPQEDLRAAAVGADALLAATTSPALRGVVAVQVARARRLLGSGTSLVAGLHGWARYAVAGYIAGGLATAVALERADYAVLEAPLRPTTRADRRRGRRPARPGGAAMSAVRRRPRRRLRRVRADHCRPGAELLLGHPAAAAGQTPGAVRGLRRGPPDRRHRRRRLERRAQTRRAGRGTQAGHLAGRPSRRPGDAGARRCRHASAHPARGLRGPGRRLRGRRDRLPDHDPGRPGALLPLGRGVHRSAEPRRVRPAAARGRSASGRRSRRLPRRRAAVDQHPARRARGPADGTGVPAAGGPRPVRLPARDRRGRRAGRPGRPVGRPRPVRSRAGVGMVRRAD